MRNKFEWKVLHIVLFIRLQQSFSFLHLVLMKRRRHHKLIRILFLSFRCLYCVERLFSVIKQVNYRGQTMNEDVTDSVPANSAGITSLAMSYNEHTILWAAGASQSIECQGLQNATFRRSYTVCDSCYIIDISVFNGRVYWAHKYPMGIYYTQGHLENGMTVEVRQYSDNIKGFRVVDLSCQPLTGDKYCIVHLQIYKAYNYIES